MELTNKNERMIMLKGFYPNYIDVHNRYVISAIQLNYEASIYLHYLSIIFGKWCEFGCTLINFPDEEGEFLLRVFTEKPCETSEN